MIPLMVYAYKIICKLLKKYFATKDLRITIDKEINFKSHRVLKVKRKFLHFGN